MNEPRQICQQCRTAIDPDATRCPNCGRRPYPTPVWTVPAFVAAVVVAAVLGLWLVSRLA